MYVEPVNGINSQQTVQSVKALQPVEKVQPAQPKAVEMKKTESTDGVKKQIQVSEDEAATWQPQTEEEIQEKQQNAENGKLKRAMEQMASTLSYSEPKFGIHEATRRITIKIVDKETQEIIKEIPPEKNLDLLAKRMELAGVLMDEKL